MSDLPPISNSPIEKSSESPKAEPHNIQYLFAQLQLSKGLACKTQADTYINKLKETQKEQKECAEMIEKARELQSKAEKNNGSVTIPDDMLEFCDKNNISYYNKETIQHYTKKNEEYQQNGKQMNVFEHGCWIQNRNYDKDKWEYTIKSLTNYQETLGTSTQTDMVQLQDYMGQYDSFLQGANSTVKELNDTLITILRG